MSRQVKEIRIYYDDCSVEHYVFKNGYFDHLEELSSRPRTIKTWEAKP